MYRQNKRYCSLYYYCLGLSSGETCLRMSNRVSEKRLLSQVKRPVNSRFCNVSSYTTELLEIRADDPKLHVLLIPGNPGVIAFYKDFLESLYEMLGGIASITAISHISHTKKDWESGKLFSLQEQIDHKVNFIKDQLSNSEVPVVLVGHSIGAYMAIETLRRCQEKVNYCIALYPFLMLNPESLWQSIIEKISASMILSMLISYTVALLGLLPRSVLRQVILTLNTRPLSDTAIEAACSQLVKYHILRNVLFLAMTEFKELSETPDWSFMRENQDKITFLFGHDDHWGPLKMFEEISKRVPGISLSIEREGHTHNFSCTEAGSVWVAQHVASLIRRNLQSSSQ
ncbi:hypothetical protein K2173_010571 [Erythroxylum novogranatense]|uniref:Lipid droplet-associated hydrolase n=1 Tax=Erythroxylum novogranatense TaxID=1862640 RepID=A0AAV8U9C0_9ROSI|nr:hypothetical protein K2173_010571 [Erythroxylum novogranatense]